MANASKLLNFVEQDGNFIKFYTELNTNYNIGDRVYISGGYYDNTSLALTNSTDPFAIGYTIIAIDSTNISNSITLNISHTDPRYTDGSGLFFSVNPVYYTEEDILKNPNLLPTAYISKVCFLSGEFNGGVFQEGVFGNYKIQNDLDNTTYINNLNSYISDNQLSNDDENYLEKLDDFYSENYTRTAIDINEFNSYFNRKFENQQAIWSNGIFLGGNWHFGEWKQRYQTNQIGYHQQLNEQGGISDPLDESKFYINEFNNNFDNLGWSVSESGNFGLLEKYNTTLAVNVIEQKIYLSFIPYILRRSLLNDYQLHLKISFNDDILNQKNGKIFTIVFENNTSYISDLDNNILHIYEELYDINTYSTSLDYYAVELELYLSDPLQYVVNQNDKILIDSLYTKNSNRNSINAGRFFNAHIYDGLYNTARIEGNWYHGLLQTGIFTSNKIQSNFYNGIVDGNAFLSDIQYHNGTIFNAIWQGASNFNILSFINFNGETGVEVDWKYRRIFKENESIFISFIKSANSSQYLPIWSYNQNESLLNFTTYTIKRIQKDYNESRVLLIIDLDIRLINSDFIENVYGEEVGNFNYNYAKVSNSNFIKGKWLNGVWETGYHNGSMIPISIDSFTSNSLTIQVSDTSNFQFGDYVSLSNIKIDKLFNFTSLIGTNSTSAIKVDDRNNVNYWQKLNEIVKITNIENYLITVDLSEISDDIENSTITSVEYYYTSTNNDDSASIAAISYQIWNDGEFNTGIWENNIFKNGRFNNIFTLDNLNTQIKNLWRSGVFQNGSMKAIILSGVFEDGVYENGTITNGYNRSVDKWNTDTSWQYGDTVWFDGVFNDGVLANGIFNDGVFNNGVIEIAAIDKVKFNFGIYTNGKRRRNNSLSYSSKYTTNALNSAPALIGIESSGWVQLDQLSNYQRDYNIIFRDLEYNSNPFSNQMFNVLDRNASSDRILISTIGKNGSNGVDIPQSFINDSLPIVVLSNIIDVVEVNSSQYWIADNGYNRIIEYNSDSGTIKPIDNITNVLDSPNIIYQSAILKATSVHEVNDENETLSEYTYVLEENRLISIHKQTLELKELLPKSTLVTASSINLIDWYDIYAFNSNALSETVFILVSYNEIISNVITEKFGLVAYDIELETYHLVVDTFSHMQNWYNNLNTFAVSDIKIKSYNLNTSINIFYKLPLDINTYQSNNIQQQRIIFTNDKWTVSTYTINQINSSLLVVDSNPFIFKDFAIKNDSPNNKYWLLAENGNSIYELTSELVVLVNNITFEKIDYLIDKIVAIGYDELESSLMNLHIIPKQTTRLGVIDTNSSIKVLDNLNSIVSEVDYWYYDKPSRRLLKMQESLSTLYDENSEYGVNDGLIFNNVVYLTNSDIFNKLVMLDILDNNNKAIKIFSKVLETLSTLTINIDSIINSNSNYIDAYYNNEYVYVLYVNNNIYYYDRIDVSQSTTNHLLKIAVNNNILLLNTNSKIAVYEDFIFLSNGNTLINYTDDYILFECESFESIVEFSFNSTSEGIYLFITIKNNFDDSHKVYRLTRINVSDTILEWAGVIENGLIRSKDIAYSTNSIIQTNYANLGNINQNVVNTNSQFNLLELDYPSGIVEDIQDIIFTHIENEIFTVEENNILHLLNSSSGLIIDEYGQYLQPLAYDIYLNNISSLTYAKWDEEYFNVFIDSTKDNYKKHLRSIQLTTNSLLDSKNKNIVSLYREGVFYDIYDNFLFEGTSGSSGLDDLSFVDICERRDTSSELYVLAKSSINKNIVFNFNYSTSGSTYNQFEVDSSEDFNGICLDDINFYIHSDNVLYEYSTSGTITEINTFYDNIKNVISANNEIYVLTENHLFQIDKYSTSGYSNPMFSIDRNTINQTKHILYNDNKTDLNILINNDLYQFVIETINNINDDILKYTKISNRLFIHTTTNILLFDKNEPNYYIPYSIIRNDVIDIIAITSNLFYVLYENNTIYRYEISDSTSGVIPTLLDFAPEYQNASYFYSAINIAKINNQLAILYRILSYDTSGDSHNDNYCDIWVYDNISSTSGLSKLNFEYSVDKNDFTGYLDPSIYYTTSGIMYSTAGTDGTSSTAGEVFITPEIVDVTYIDIHPYSIKGKYITNNLSNLYVYHNDDNGLVWEVSGGDIVYNTAANAINFSFINSSKWVVLTATNLIVENNGNSNTLLDNTSFITYENDNTFILSIDSYYAYVENIYTNSKIALLPYVYYEYNLTNVYQHTTNSENYAITTYDLTVIPTYTTNYDNKPIVYTYKAVSTIDNSLVSPNVSARILKNTIWDNGSFNSGDGINAAYTAHLVSSKWLSGNFIGSWDLPNFFDHTSIKSNSLFIGGVFGSNEDGLTGLWNNGLFLGGVWRNGSFNNGHILPENDTLIENIEFNTTPVNIIEEMSFDFDRNQMKIEVRHIQYNLNDCNYEDVPSQLSKFQLIRIPNVFQIWELNITEVRKNIYPIKDKNEVILITNIPPFDIPHNWLNGKNIYISKVNEYVEYFHGNFIVVDSFTYENQLYIIIENDFDDFDVNGRYMFNQLPIIDQTFFRIQDIEFSDTMYNSTLYIDLPIIDDTNSAILDFIKNNLLIESIDVVTAINSNSTSGYKALNYGSIVLSEHVLLFNRTTTNSIGDFVIENVNTLSTMLIDGIDIVNYTGDVDISDIIVNNSKLTSTNNVNIINSLIYSGETNLNIINSGWLNIDNKGFSNATSTYSGSQFTGDISRIIEINEDADRNYLWITLNKPLSNIDENQFIFLRGFTGNKSQLIGNSHSKTFRIIDLNKNKIKINNPFKYYYNDNVFIDENYKTVFDLNQIVPYQKEMNLTPTQKFTFNYAFASTTVWNGGIFNGGLNTSNFTSVWNAGIFNPSNDNTTFNGLWFGTPESYYYTNLVSVTITQIGVQYKLSISLSTNGILWEDGDLVYIKFLNNLIPSFYTTITNGVITKLFDLQYPSTNYVVEIIRYKAGNKIILDRNLNIGPEKDSLYHQLIDKNIYNYLDNKALDFNGSVYHDISYFNEYLLENLSIDFWFNTDNVVNTTYGQVLFSLNQDGNSLAIGVNGSNDTFFIRYAVHLNTVNPSYIQIDHTIPSGWNHVYIYIDNDILKVYIDSNFVFVNDSGVIINNNGVWNITTSNYSSGFIYDVSKLGNVYLGIEQVYIDSILTNRIANSGKIDNIRIWKKELSVAEIDIIRNGRILSKRFNELYIKLGFDDFENDNTIFNKSNIIINEIEYIENLPIPDTDYTLDINFSILKLTTIQKVFTFTSNKTIDLFTEKIKTIEAIRFDSTSKVIDYYFRRPLFELPSETSFVSLNLTPSIENSNQILGNVDSLDNILIEYNAKSNNGFGPLEKYLIISDDISIVSGNRIQIHFTNTNITIAYGSGTLVETEIINGLSIPNTYTNYWIYLSVIDDDINIKIGVGNEGRLLDSLIETTIPSPFTLDSYYIANAITTEEITYNNRIVSLWRSLASSTIGSLDRLIISDTNFIFNPSNALTALESIDLESSVYIHLGDSLQYNTNKSNIQYFSFDIYDSNGLDIFNSLITQDYSKLKLIKYYNASNIINFSDYNILYPTLNTYNSTSGLVSEYPTEFTYYIGHSFDTLKTSNVYGDNYDFGTFGTSGIQLEYYDAEIFAINENGLEVWTENNVSWTSEFNSGVFNSKLWYAGYFNNGSMFGNNQLWKWGIHNNGEWIEDDVDE